MTVTPEAARRELARRELTRRQGQPSIASSTPAPRSFLNSQASRLLFPGVGQALGTAAGIGVGGMAGGVGAVPGGLIGAGTGAGAGEALRQLLGSLMGEGPKTTEEALRRPVEEAAVGMAGEAAGPAMGAAAGTIGRVGRAATKRIGQLVTSVSPEAIGRVFERGASNVITPEFQAFAKGGVPERIQTSVVNGFERFRDGAEQAYDKAIEGLKPEINQAIVDATSVVKGFHDRLVKSNVVSSTGKLVKTILGKQIAPEVPASQKKLVGILNRLQQFPQGRVPAEQAIRLKRELDTLLDFDPNAIAKMTKQSQALLFGLRTSLKESIEQAVPGLRAANDKYHLFRDLYDAIQPRLRDPNIETTLRGLTKNRNTYNFRILQEIDAATPPDQKFLVQVLDFLAGSEFGKDPELMRMVPLRIAGVLSAMGGNVAGGLGILGAAEATSPRAFGATLRGAERIAQPMKQVGRGAQRTAPVSVSTLLRTLGLSSTQE